jgi:TRAP-type C4-dicarboxylate transport system permease small subunit
MNFHSIVQRVNYSLFHVGGAALVFMMLITVADVILRKLGHPIIGTYEIVSFTGAVVIGFCIPWVTMRKSQIAVDFLTMRMSGKTRKTFRLWTRIVGIVLWSLIGYNLFLLGRDLYRSGEVSLTLQLPFYPVAFGIAFCCFLQSITQILEFADTLKEGV